MSDENIDSSIEGELQDVDDWSNDDAEEMFDMFTGQAITQGIQDEQYATDGSWEEVDITDGAANSVNQKGACSDHDNQTSSDLKPQPLRRVERPAFTGTENALPLADLDVRALNAEAHLPFQYDELPEEWSFRVLDILPADNQSEPLQCGMISTEMTRTYYLAISYSWGQTYDDGSHLTHSVPCNGRLLKITSKLYTALLTIREHLDAGKWVMFGQRPHVWVDAMCINQEVLRERNHQVQIMNQIYSKAFGILIWLGEAPSGRDAALVRTANILSSEDSQPTAQDDFVPEFKQDEMVALLQRPWFRRRWVIQEFAVQKNRIILFGKSAMDFKSFFTVAKFYGLDKQTGPMQHAELWGYFRPNRWLMNNLHRFHDAECSDDHDTVYALLNVSCGCESARSNSRCGVPDCGSKNFKVDYSQSVRSMFVHLARCFFKADAMPVLASACIRSSQDTNKRSDWPSWVPDWRVSPDGCSPSFRRLVDSCFETPTATSPAPAFVLNAETVAWLAPGALKAPPRPQSIRESITLRGYILHQPPRGSTVSSLTWMDGAVPDGMSVEGTRLLRNGDWAKHHPGYYLDGQSTFYESVRGDWPDVDPEHIIMLLFGYQLVLVLSDAGSGQYNLVDCVHRTAPIRKTHFAWIQKATGNVWAYGNAMRALSFEIV